MLPTEEQSSWWRWRGGRRGHSHCTQPGPLAGHLLHPPGRISAGRVFLLRGANFVFKRHLFRITHYRKNTAVNLQISKLLEIYDFGKCKQMWIMCTSFNSTSVIQLYLDTTRVFSFRNKKQFSRHCNCFLATINPLLYLLYSLSTHMILWQFGNFN